MATTSAKNQIFELCSGIEMIRKHQISGHQKSGQVYWLTCGDFSEYNHIAKHITFLIKYQKELATLYFGGESIDSLRTEHYEALFLCS